MWHVPTTRNDPLGAEKLKGCPSHWNSLILAVPREIGKLPKYIARSEGQASRIAQIPSANVAQGVNDTEVRGAVRRDDATD